MPIRLVLCAIISAVFAAAVANPDIKVECGTNSVKVTWTISSELVPYAARFFLGSCMPLTLNILPDDEGELYFESNFDNCRFTKRVKGKNVHYQNELTYRPYVRFRKPAAYVYPVNCVKKRDQKWIPSFLNPGSGISENWGELVFHVALLNEHLTRVAKTNIIPLGSYMPIWAAVEQKSHQPLLLLMEECVAASSAELQESSQVYPIVTNKGCISASAGDHARFLPRYHSSALILYLQSFKVPNSNQIYIHCNLIAWDPESLSEDRKACNYKKPTESWELLDDPSQSSLCECCQSTCRSRIRRGVAWDSFGFRHKSVLGPLIIVAPSEAPTTAGNLSLSSDTTRNW
ncbi:unnamed protein product [Tetraodon nigroviridis]|uniref:(spotted green pufferfish) hypothetical protein n=1 Tax=Tetraodon nigroviridis TaxID=99883 RepID=Q4SNR8_TETNG|nr:unnamed protein product [Tetraodon nigroviridis]